ncbi:MAG: sensor histidine kinase [Chlorobiaceae bacterium]
MELYTDQSGALTLADLLSPSTRAHFIPLKGNLTKGYTTDIFWLRFTVTRTTSFPETAWLRLYPSYIDHVEIYVQNGDDPTNPLLYKKNILGEDVPVAQRPLQHSDFVVPIPLSAMHPVTVYVRLHSASPINVAATIHTRDNLADETTKSIMFNSGYLGVALFIALVTILFYLRTKDLVYLFFALYGFGMFISRLGLSGLLNTVVAVPSIDFFDNIHNLGMSIARISLSLFAITKFSTVRWPWIHRAFIFFTVVIGLSIFSIPLGLYDGIRPALMMSISVMPLLLIWLSFRAMTDRVGGAAYFFAAFIVGWIGYLVDHMRLLGLIQLEWWNIDAIHVASLIFMILMTMALIAHYREHTKKVEAALIVERRAYERQHSIHAMLSHEYRTPLTVIRTSIDVMRLLEADLENPYRERLDIIEKAVDRLVEVMEISLNRSRLVDPARESSHTLFPVEPFVESLLDEARLLWHEHTFTCSRAESVGHISGDQHFLKTAFFNLLDNARKYALPETPIHLLTRKRGDEIAISIANMVNDDTMQKGDELFEKYRRGDNISDVSGSGLGLWLTRQIIEEHKGSVSLEHAAGEVVVTINLPLAGQLCLSLESERNKSVH